VTEQPRHDELDELLRPTLQGRAARPADAPRPWRLGSIVYVAFFGGALAAAAISLLNARRLGRPASTQVAIAALGAAGFAAVLVVAALVGEDSLRIPIRVVALVAFGGMYLLQRSADRVYHYHQRDEDPYESLWGPGLAAVFTLGVVETLAAYGVAS
jgi:hypothetical protein